MQTYEPAADLSKVEKQRQKYPYQVLINSIQFLLSLIFVLKLKMQEEIGFRVTGFKVCLAPSFCYQVGLMCTISRSTMLELDTPFLCTNITAAA
jgi:hypothetical protein